MSKPSLAFCFVSNPHPPANHTPNPPSPRPTGQDFSPTYFSIAGMYCLHCGHRKAGGRSSVMRLPCFSLEKQAPGQGLGSDLKSGCLNKILCSAFNRHACFLAPKNATHWCCGFQKSPPSVPVFSWKFYVGHQMLSKYGLDSMLLAASFAVSRTLCSWEASWTAGATKSSRHFLSSGQSRVLAPTAVRLTAHCWYFPVSIVISSSPACHMSQQQCMWAFAGFPFLLLFVSAHPIVFTTGAPRRSSWR